jgi:hypothetical protein
MYKIIGGDQKEYGPVSAEELRRWVAEGRANAQTLIWAEGTTEWKPLAAFPEFADLLGAVSPPPSTPPGGHGAGGLSPEELLARDYELDIGNCLTRSWELVKKNLGPVVGITLLVMVIVVGVNQLLGLLTGPATQDMIVHRRLAAGPILIICAVSVLGTPIYTVLIGGLYRYYLKLIRGEAAGIADAFSGFGPAIGQLALFGLVSGLLSLIAFCLCVLPSIYVSVAWTFSIPLIMDRGMGFWDAMELSRKVVTKHWFLVFAFLLVVGLVACCGVIACCVGLVVTIPIGWVALMYAYEDIFGRQAA